MKFKVCDALCGSGKTVACINMINRDDKRKFLFITPYLTEVDRIVESCSSHHFTAPERKYPVTKSENIKSLIKNGCNIASTHALFSNFTREIKLLLLEQHYTLILDEVLDLFTDADLTPADIRLLEQGDVLKVDKEGEFTLGDTVYENGRFTDIVLATESHMMVKCEDNFFIWQIPIDIFACFDEVVVLTYLFECQPLRYYIEAKKVDYELIGVKSVGSTYEFCPLEEMDRSRDLRDKVHIVTREKYNRIGEKDYTLSSTWYKKESLKRDRGKVTLMKKQLYNVFSYHFKAKSEDVLWTTFLEQRGKLKGKGYSNGFLAFNMKAINDYSNKHYLAYTINLFMLPWLKRYLHKISNQVIDEDMYALSMLVQWLFRSAIRKGEEIWIYIPSARMRYLLTEWIENLYRGEDLKRVTYPVPPKKGKDDK